MEAVYYIYSGLHASADETWEVSSRFIVLRVALNPKETESQRGRLGERFSALTNRVTRAYKCTPTP